MPSLNLSILKLHDFRMLVLTRMFVHMALNCQAVIVGWQIYSITKSELLLGLTGLVEAIPAICSALFSGYIVDNSSPRKVYTIAVAVLTLNTLLLMLLGGGYIAVGNTGLIIGIYMGIFISGVARSFTMPSLFSLVGQIVERSEYSSSAGWLNTSFQCAVIIAPAIAGMIYGFSGATGAWMLPTAFMALALLCALNFRHLRAYQRPAEREPAWQSIKAGWMFILRNRLILAIMSVDMFAVLFGGAVALLPAYADKVLHVGPEGLGVLRSATAVGALLSAFYFSIRPLRKFTLNRLLVVTAGFGFAMIGFGLSTHFALSAFFLAMSGMFDSISVIIRQTLKQILTPEHMRGRVSSVSSMFIISSNEIGAFESGAAAHLLGLVPSIVFGGVMSLIVVMSTYFFTPNIRKIVVDEHSKTGAE